MIVQLQAKQDILVDTFNSVIAKPRCKITEFNYSSLGFIIRGYYFYLNSAQQEVITRNFEMQFSKAQINGLYTSLNITPNLNLSYTEQRDVEILAGLKYIIAQEGRWGLTINDWE